MIIDSDDYEAAGIEVLTFPGGEPHVKLPADLKGDILFVLHARNPLDTFRGALVMDALDRKYEVRQLDVFVPYFPGARQDKIKAPSALTIEVTAMMLSFRDWSHSHNVKLHVFDIHSLLAREQIGRYTPCTFWEITDLDITPETGVIGIIAPDEGARRRAEAFRDKFYPTAAMLHCQKHRDPVTGEITAYTMPPLPAAGGYIIVDDICDGGWTFNELAKAFKADPLGASSYLELFVSHGIFSKGLNAIDRTIKRITTTDSWCAIPEAHHSRLQVIKLETLYKKMLYRVQLGEQP